MDAKKTPEQVKREAPEIEPADADQHDDGPTVDLAPDQPATIAEEAPC